MAGRTHDAAGADGSQGPGRTAREAEQLVTALLRRARSGGAGAGTVLDGADGAELRGTVTTLLGSAVSTALAGAWRRGWQPADLGREAGRSLPIELHHDLVDRIREELATYARSTVDPSWWAQLAELEEACAARRPRRRGGRPDDDADPLLAWRRSCGRRATVTVFVERLFPLPLIGPLPGEARQVEADAPEVDDKTLTKVRRLLAQAEGTPYEAEAETFTAAAQSLMARYRIDRAMLEESDPQHRRGGPGAARLSVCRPYEQPKALLLSVVAGANRCQAVWSQGQGFVTVLGHQADRDAVEVLFTSLLVQGTTAMRREGDKQPRHARSRGYRSSFLAGFATRVGQRLEEASTTAEREASAELSAGQGEGGPDAGTSAGQPDTDRLALVLRRRDEEVEALLADLFPVTSRTRSRTISDYAGFAQGRAAADRADLGVGARLDGRAS